MTRSKRQRSHLRQSLRVESLESRRVMTRDALGVISVVQPAAVQLWADSFVRQHWGFAKTDSTEKVLQFESQQEAQTALVDALVSQWKDTLGVTLDRDTYSTSPVSRFFRRLASTFHDE